MSLNTVSLAQPCCAWFQCWLLRSFTCGHGRRSPALLVHTRTDQKGPKQVEVSGQKQIFKVFTESWQQQRHCPTVAREPKPQPGCECGDTVVWGDTETFLLPARAHWISHPHHKAALPVEISGRLGSSAARSKEHPSSVWGWRREVMVETAKGTFEVSHCVGLQVGPRCWWDPSQEYSGPWCRDRWPELYLSGDTGISTGQKCFWQLFFFFSDRKCQFIWKIFLWETKALQELVIWNEFFPSGQDKQCHIPKI